MKAIIIIKRLTEYSTIVEMLPATFKRLNKSLEGGRAERRSAEQELNGLIDTRDWQDDEFDSLESVEENGYVSTICQPSILRESNDVAFRMDRLKSIGNGQVPAVVRLAWETLK